LLNQKLAKEYVEIRASIVRNPQIMMERWGPKGYIATRSSVQMYTVFQKEMPELLHQSDQREITRSVHVLADPIKVDEHFYQIEFETIDVEAGAETHKKWVASLVIENRPQAVDFKDRFLNPTGFTVVGYSVVQKV